MTARTLNLPHVVQASLIAATEEEARSPSKQPQRKPYAWALGLIGRDGLRPAAWNIGPRALGARAILGDHGRSREIFSRLRSGPVRSLRG